MKRNRPAKLASIFLATLLCITPAFAAADPAQPLLKAGAAVTVNYAVDQGFEWQYDSGYSDAAHAAYQAGNSGNAAKSISNIGLTVTQPGILSFDYRIGTESSGNSYNMWFQFGSPITDGNYTSALNYGESTSYRGTVPWTHKEITVAPSDLVSGSATLYIAYRHGAFSGASDNKVTIANVGFASGMKTFTLTVDGTAFGDVTGASIGGNQLPSGTAISLTATAKPGGRFYGWMGGRGSFISTDPTYTATLSDDTGVRAVFAAEGSYAARRGSAFYTQAQGGLAQALAESSSGDQIAMLENQTIAANAEVKAGVSLYIPYDASYDADGVVEGTVYDAATQTNPYPASLKIAGDDKAYRTLTINSGVTFTVNGSLTVGSVMSYPAMNGYQCHTSGAHGKIANNGTIVVGSGGKLDSWGIVDGSGTVTVQSGAKVYEPFIVVDFVGGSNTSDLYFDSQSPFRHWAIQNIQNTLTLDPGSELLVHCNLYAGGHYNATDVAFVSSAKSLFHVNAATRVVRTYNGAKATTLCPDLGETTYTVSGGMQFEAMDMEVAGIKVATDNVDFPMPYNISFVMENGSYSLPRRLKLMPGCRFTVENGATLTVSGTAFPIGNGGATEKPALFVHNGLRQDPMSGKGYPDSPALQAAGYSQSGELIVNGALVVQSGGIFGGIVQTAGTTGVITIAPGATLATARLQDGTKGTYDDNTSVCAISARAYVGGAITPLAAGSYRAAGATAWALPGYDATYMTDATKAEYDAFCAITPQITDKFDLRYVNYISTTNLYHKWKSETIPINQPMIGGWAKDGAQPGTGGVTVVNKTVYSPTDATRTSVANAVVKPDKTIVFQVKKTAAGKGYVWLVDYQKAGESAPTKLNPAANGDYTIAGVDADVTITVTAVLLGDVNLDGVANSADALSVLIAENGNAVWENIKKIAADINADGVANSADALLVLTAENANTVAP